MTALSICIPTFNRAKILEHALAHLPDIDADVVVSDNCSTDETAEVVYAAGETDHRIRYERTSTQVGPFESYRLAMLQARGEFAVYLADDDSIMAEPLMLHVETMQAYPKLAAMYTDWIAWNDAEQREVHRYFGGESVVIENDPAGLLNYLFRTANQPEIGVFRTSAMRQAFTPVGYALPSHIWAYQLSRLGQIGFNLIPFYREHQVMRADLCRGQPANLSLAHAYIGDEQRLGLECMALMAGQDAGIKWDRTQLRDAIDRMLHTRTRLEILRARQRGDMVTADQLECRLALWAT